MRIEELKERIPVARVIEHFGGKIEGSARDRWVPVRCPFHRDKNASASVHRRLGRFVCFACDVRGDIVDLARAGANISQVRDAIEWLEQRFL